MTAEQHNAMVLQQQQQAYHAQQLQIGQQQPPAITAQPLAAQPAAQPVEQPPGMTPLKWGEILASVVGHHEAGADPHYSVQQLFILSQEINAIEGIPELAAGTVDQAVAKAKMASMVVTDARYKIPIDKFVAMGQPGTPARQWLDSYFAIVREGWAEVQRLQREQMAPAPVAPAPQEPAPAAPVAEEPPAAPPPVVEPDLNTPPAENF
jgi:hypothetical protein